MFSWEETVTQAEPGAVMVLNLGVTFSEAGGHKR